MGVDQHLGGAEHVVPGPGRVHGDAVLRCATLPSVIGRHRHTLDIEMLYMVYIDIDM